MKNYKKDYRGKKLNIHDQVKLKTYSKYNLDKDQIYTILYFSGGGIKAHIHEVGKKGWAVVRTDELIKTDETPEKVTIKGDK